MPLFELEAVDNDGNLFTEREAFDSEPEAEAWAVARLIEADYLSSEHEGAEFGDLTLTIPVAQLNQIDLVADYVCDATALMEDGALPVGEVSRKMLLQASLDLAEKVAAVMAQEAGSDLGVITAGQWVYSGGYYPPERAPALHGLLESAQRAADTLGDDLFTDAPECAGSVTAAQLLGDELKEKVKAGYSTLGLKPRQQHNSGFGTVEAGEQS